ncbi:hypothetical protein KP509_06G005800 [Ceratopteris richardii]|uniref:ATP-dependent RNA helicase PRP5/DDX46/KHDC4 KH domain-containing protein n=1 Tax=Ceratopteris richardii TaxID=49495 RepID=A0A8T2UFG5_CERRI|nr:hypothetical protein KP509_06G005800 [Ceratopteris richardii]
MAEEVKVEANTEPSTRQRKKRKWDQPAENILAASAGAAGFMPTAALTGINLPGIFPSSMGVYPTMSASTACAQMPFMFSTVQQSAAAIIQKINQDLVAKGVAPINKIQDEMIAREIVINDADAAVRYKLTKRQTQEEIQAKTGAVVITRGKYKPPNGTVDHEKPLYLHISAGAHLKDTAERVKAVDQAAALIDEMLKQGRQVPVSAVNGQVGQTNSPLTAVVFVDFEADTSVDLISRIRGSNVSLLAEFHPCIMYSRNGFFIMIMFASILKSHDNFPDIFMCVGRYRFFVCCWPGVAGWILKTCRTNI